MASHAPVRQSTYEIWIGGLRTTYRELVEATAELLPNLLGAVLIVLVGWGIAWLLRALILRVGDGLDRLFEMAKLRAGQPAVELRWPLSRIVAYSAYWLAIVFFLTAATRLLGIPGVTELLSNVLLYLPVLLVTAAVLLVIYLASCLVGDITESAAKRAGMASAASLGPLVRIVIVGVASVIALGHIGIDNSLLVNVTTVIFAVALGGAAIAFGMGAAADVQNMIASRRARRHYSAGQRIRIGDTEGEIVEITREAIVIDGRDGRTRVPARLLSEQVSVLVADSDEHA